MNPRIFIVSNMKNYDIPLEDTNLKEFGEPIALLNKYYPFDINRLVTLISAKLIEHKFNENDYLLFCGHQVALFSLGIAVSRLRLLSIKTLVFKAVDKKYVEVVYNF